MKFFAKIFAVFIVLLIVTSVIVTFVDCMDIYKSFN
jgi:hypothetical protein